MALRAGQGIEAVVTALGEPTHKRDMGNGHLWLDYVSACILDRAVSVSLHFENERLQSVRFQLKRDGDQNYWNADEDTFQERLIKHRAEHDRFLADQLGKPTKTDPYTIFIRDGVRFSSYTDAKGGFADMSISWEAS